MLWKRILIVIDNSEGALKAVEYVGQMFCNRDDLEFALVGFHEKLPKHDIDRETSPFYNEVVGRLTGFATDVEKGRVYINQIKDLMCRMGMNGDKIQVVYQPMKFKKIEKDIAEYVHSEGYGTILLGSMDAMAVNLAKGLKGATIIVVG